MAIQLNPAEMAQQVKAARVAIAQLYEVASTLNNLTSSAEKLGFSDEMKLVSFSIGAEKVANTLNTLQKLCVGIVLAPAAPAPVDAPAGDAKP